MPSDQSDVDLAEWTQARSVISSFDDRLDALRKTGLTLVSTLITADALLLPSSIGGASALPALAKFAVLLATLLLVTAVELTDRNYRVIQQASAQRALILERTMNLELTEVITERFAFARINLTVYAVYLLMGAAVLTLGLVVLNLNLLFWILFLIFAVWAVSTNFIFALTYGTPGPVDWSLSGQRIEKDAPIEITVTNLASGGTLESFRWRKTLQPNLSAKCLMGQTVWRFEAEGTPFEGTPLYERKAETDLEIPCQGNFVWQLALSEIPHRLQPGVYQIRPCLFYRDGRTGPWGEPLRRKITLVREPRDTHATTASVPPA